MMEKYANTHVCVPFSAGLDSTAVAAMLGDIAKKVTLLNFEASTPTVKYEQLRLRKIMDKLNDMYPKTEYQLVVIPVDYNAALLDVNIGMQMTWWASLLPMYVPTSCKHVLMGWVSDDGTHQLASQFKTAVETMRAFFTEPFSVEFPLLDKTKLNIIEMYYARFKGLAKHVWWCENPTNHYIEYFDHMHGSDPETYTDRSEHVACGKCHSCLAMLSAITDYKGNIKSACNELFDYPFSVPYWVEQHPEFHVDVNVLMGIIRPIAKAVFNKRIIKLNTYFNPYVTSGPRVDLVMNILAKREAVAMAMYHFIAANIVEALGYKVTQEEYNQCISYLQQNLYKHIPLPKWSTAK